MTPQEWQQSDSVRAMFDHLVRNRKNAPQKLRLLTAACCRLLWDRIPEGPCRKAVEVAERYAIEEASEVDLRSARRSIPRHRGRSLSAGCRADITWLVEHALYENSSTDMICFDLAMVSIGSNRLDFLPALIRDIFGPNPEEPVIFDPNWLTSDVVAMARGMFETNDFSAMPILADALQDAGCENEAILNHCRGDGPHVRGNWVVSGILGHDLDRGAERGR